ncbi:MAG: outer membrane beta-barrel protein [Bacteroidota bacterium]
MKKTIITIIGILIIGMGYSQVDTESTIRKFNIGVGVSTDIWQGLAPDMKVRTINQGAQVFGMYNHQIKESNIYLAGGIGVSTHNMYSDNYIDDVKADSISFMKVPDDVGYKRSKICLAYIDVPLEFRYKTEKHFRIAIGFKFGYMINSHTKYIGNRMFKADDGTITTDKVNVKEKEKDISQVETWRYGPTLRLGYKWFNVTLYYQLSKVFMLDKGPQLYPISIGVAVVPF